MQLSIAIALLGRQNDESRKSQHAACGMFGYPLHALIRVASKRRALDFTGTLRNLLDLSDGASELDTLIQHLPTASGNQG